MDLTEEQWKFVEPLLPKPKVRTDGRGRPWRDPRDVLDGTLWVLRTGAPWKDLPPRYPPYQTCHRRFQQWSRDGTIEKILYRLARHLQERRRDRPHRGLHRWHLRRGQKGGPAVGKTKKGKGTKIMAIADGAGLPLAAWTTSASPAEVTLVEQTIDASFYPWIYERLIGDKASDSDALDERLWEERGIELISPNRRNRKVRTQDGRPLRRYKRRWKMERLFAWLQNFRRLVTRYERHAENFQGFVHLGCMVILLRYL